MAQQVIENPTTGGFKKDGKRKADAYINIQIKDADGNLHNLNAYNPLFEEDSRLQRSLINKAKASPEGEVVIECVVKVRVAATDDGTDIAL